MGRASERGGGDEEETRSGLVVVAVCATLRVTKDSLSSLFAGLEAWQTVAVLDALRHARRNETLARADSQRGTAADGGRSAAGGGDRR